MSGNGTGAQPAPAEQEHGQRGVKQGRLASGPPASPSTPDPGALWHGNNGVAGLAQAADVTQGLPKDEDIKAQLSLVSSALQQHLQQAHAVLGEEQPAQPAPSDGASLEDGGDGWAQATRQGGAMEFGGTRLSDGSLLFT